MKRKAILALFVIILALLTGLAVVLGNPPIIVTPNQPLSTVVAGDVLFAFTVVHNTTGVRCNLTIDSTVILDQTNVAGGTTIQHTETLTIGAHSWKASCSDSTLENSTELITFNAADLTGPTITLLSPEDSNASPSQDIEFSFNIQDETGIENCTISIDSTVRSTLTNPETGTHQRTLTLAEGSHSWSVTCIDNASYTSTTSETRTITIDLTQPTVTINNPANWHNTTLETTVFNISVDEEASCELKVDSATEQTFSLEAGSSERIPVLLPDGEHTYEAICTDEASNSGSAEGKITRYDMDVSDLIIEVATDQQTYLPGEPLDILVNATDSSTVNVIIRRDSTITYNYTYIHTGGASPPGVFLNTPGTYTLEGTATFLELQKSDTSLFMVSNSSQGLLCSITADQNGFAGVAHPFTGNAYNAFGTVSYSWDFNSDGIAEALGQTKSYTFQNIGIKTVTLTITDSVDQVECSFNVQMDRIHTLKVIVLDNTTGSVMPNVAVETANISADTDSEGIASLLLEQGSHFLLVSKLGYNPHYEHIEVASNSTKTVRLQQKLSDTIKPALTITSPTQGSTVGGNPLSLAFTVLDQSTTECILYFSPYSGWWSVEDDTIIITPSGTQAVSYSHPLSTANLSDGTYHWKVSCEDIEGNSIESGNLSFTYSKTASAPQQVTYTAVPTEELVGVEKVRDMIKRLETAIDRVRKLSPEESEVAELLEIPLHLDRQKTSMIKVQNDYFKTIDPNTLVETEDNIAEYNRDHKQDVDYVEDETIVWAEVLQHIEFMKYEFPDDIETIVKEYYSFMGESKSEKEIEQLSADLNDLQAEITLATKAYLLNITYLSGDTANFTLIRHEITFKNDSAVSSKSVFLERIPKSIAQSAGDLEYISNYQVLKDDPLLRLYPDSKNIISYYVKHWADLPLMKDISTIVIDEDALAESVGTDNKVTGFAVGNLVKGTQGKILLFCLIISILGSLILSLQGGYISTDILSNIPLLSRDKPRENREDEPRRRNRRENTSLTSIVDNFRKKGDHKKALKEVDYLVDDIDDALELRKHERAKKLYRELTDYYTQIGPNHQRDFRNICSEFSSRLNLSWGEKLLSQAFESIDLGEVSKAKSAYKQLTTVYPHLDVESKAHILPKTKKLLARLHTRDMQTALRALESAIASNNRQAASRAYAAVQRAYKTLPATDKKQTFKRISALRTRMK